MLDNFEPEEQKLIKMAGVSFLAAAAFTGFIFAVAPMRGQEAQAVETSASATLPKAQISGP